MRAVERAILLLQTLGQRNMSFSELVRKVNLPKGTVHRLLGTLIHHQLVARHTHSDTYMLGPALIRMSSRIMADYRHLAMLAEPHMQSLRDSTGETIVLTAARGRERVAVLELPSPHELCVTLGARSVGQFYAGAGGKLLLAHMPSSTCAELLDSTHLESLTPNTITERDALLAELAEIRRRGYATSFGERIPGAACISVPVRRPDGEVVAALSILGPESRLGRERLLALLPDLQERADAISRQLGASTSGALPASLSPDGAL